MGLHIDIALPGYGFRFTTVNQVKAEALRTFGDPIIDFRDFARSRARRAFTRERSCMRQKKDFADEPPRFQYVPAQIT